MNRKKTLLLQYGITLALGAALALAIAYGRQSAVALMALAGENRTLWCLSDGFFVSGMVFTAVGAMTWVSTTGFFDIFSYGFHSLLVLFSTLKNPKEHEHFYEYKLHKEERRKASPKFILVVGLALLAAGVLCYLGV